MCHNKTLPRPPFPPWAWQSKSMCKFRTTARKVKFSFVDFLVKVKTPQFPADLILFLKVIFKVKLKGFVSSHFQLLMQHGMSP